MLNMVFFISINNPTMSHITFLKVILYVVVYKQTVCVGGFQSVMQPKAGLTVRSDKPGVWREQSDFLNGLHL